MEKSNIVTGHSGIGCSKSIIVASTGDLSGLLNSQPSNDVLYFYHVDHLGTP